MTQPPSKQVKRIARSGFRGLGVDVRRIRPGASDAAPQIGYYAISPTCQIPDLSFLYELYLGARDDGVFVEVGGYDGYTCSNTSGLAEAGWAGHYLEPVPASAARCREHHAGHPRVQVHELAVGRAAGALTIHVGGIYSTADETTLTEYEDVSWAKESFAPGETVEAVVTTLDAFLDEQSIGAGFDVLVVDVEGAEPDVFAAFDLARFRPRSLIVELADTHRDLVRNRSAHARVLSDIVAGGYSIVYKDAINTMFVTDEIYRAVHDL